MEMHNNTETLSNNDVYHDYRSSELRSNFELEV